MDEEDDDFENDIRQLAVWLEQAEQSDFPRMSLSLDDYRQLWAPWCRALIVKVLGCTFMYRLLEQKIHDLWKLEWENGW